MHIIVNYAKNIHKEQLNLNSNEAFLVKVVDPKNLVFSKFIYNSSEEKVEPFSNPEQKLSSTLSNYGLGE